MKSILTENVVFKVIEHDTEEYHSAVSLRERILRTPFGLTFTNDELAAEKHHIHIVGSHNSEIIATAVLVPEGNQCKMQRVVVKEDLVSLGIGSKMMTFCEAYAKGRGFTSIYCHARDSAVNFYLKNDYISEGDYFEEDTILHLKMRKFFLQNNGQMKKTILETERLILRTWDTSDIQAYFDINQDPAVIQFLRGPLTIQEVQDFIPAVNAHQEKHGYTLWAAEIKETKQLIGFIGLNYTDWNGKLFTPAVEVGWRLGSQYWGKGYATEGAKGALDFGFNKIGLNEIVSFTVPVNTRSITVMERIGLKRDPKGDFAHPKLEASHPLSLHVLYRLTKDEYNEKT